MCRTLGHHGFYFIQDAVGLGGSSHQILFAQALLFQISHHDGSIQVSFRHLVKVYQYLRVATGEVYLLVEEHRCVAMRVECEDTVMQAFGFHEGSGFS